MYQDDYFEELNEFEYQIEEFKTSLLIAVKKEHQDEIVRLYNENTRLSAIESEMKEKTDLLDRELINIERKKKNLKSEAESEFWALTINEVIDRIVDECIVWYAESKEYQGEKCGLCNDARMQTSQYPDGTEVSKKCTCSKSLYSYEPEISKVKKIKIAKKDSYYRSDRNFFLTKTFIPSDSSNDYSYGEFSIGHVVTIFCEETKILHEDKKYGEKIAFTSKEECQKYCDWLNKGEKE